MDYNEKVLDNVMEENQDQSLKLTKDERRVERIELGKKRTHEISIWMKKLFTF